MKKSTVKNLTTFIILIIIFWTLGFINTNHYLNAEGWINSWIIVYLTGCIFLFSFTLRKIYWFKPYFVSKYNILTSKVRYMKEFDFSKEILFEKFIEALHNAGFKIIMSNKNSGDIFAITKISWRSYGENIYITLKENSGNTTVDFCSACFFQVYSWGNKNEINYEKLIKEFENSLII
jgi:hypothetical protein